MNAVLVRQALEKVRNPNALVSLVSQRGRQLNAGGGGRGRPLVAELANLGAADIALREVVEAGCLPPGACAERKTPASSWRWI